MLQVHLQRHRDLQDQQEPAKLVPLALIQLFLVLPGQPAQVRPRLAQPEQQDRQAQVLLFPAQQGQRGQILQRLVQQVRREQTAQCLDRQGLLDQLEQTARLLVLQVPLVPRELIQPCLDRLAPRELGSLAQPDQQEPTQLFQAQQVQRDLRGQILPHQGQQDQLAMRPQFLAQLDLPEQDQQEPRVRQVQA